MLATGPVISVALIWKLLKTPLLTKEPLLLNRFPDDVAIPVGVVLGKEENQSKDPLLD